MQVVINRCYGGFGLSQRAFERLAELGGSDLRDCAWDDDKRSHPLLIQVVEELGKAANGSFADLKVVEIPDGIDYQIEEYDGIEWVSEKHRTWE